MPTVLLLLLFTPGDLSWETDLDAALASARRTGRPILVYIYRDGDSACRRLEQEVFPDPGFREMLQECTRLALPADGERTVERLTHGRTVLPMLIALDVDGREIVRTAGALPAPVLLERLRETMGRYRPPPRDPETVRAAVRRLSEGIAHARYWEIAEPLRFLRGGRIPEDLQAEVEGALGRYDTFVASSFTGVEQKLLQEHYLSAIGSLHILATYLHEEEAGRRARERLEDLRTQLEAMPPERSDRENDPENRWGEIRAARSFRGEGALLRARNYLARGRPGDRDHARAALLECLRNYPEVEVAPDAMRIFKREFGEGPEAPRQNE